MSSDPPVLTGQQRKWLRGRAHPLKPLVHVGEAGLSEAVIAATKAALDQHELIKIRLHQPSQKRETAARLRRQYKGVRSLGKDPWQKGSHMPHPRCSTERTQEGHRT